jgi:DNA primase
LIISVKYQRYFSTLKIKYYGGKFGKMAKISPVSIKYMIYAKMEAEGTVEKPDVIGAVFGQTEGLLGTDLEMRDLQKEGKIGRIEVSLEKKNGKTVGEIQIPSALDKTETTLIAAAMETIERIGPSNAKLKVEKIEDVRENKREYILERAKKLLENIEEKMPKTREIAKNLKVGARESRIQEYGKAKLPAGDLSGDEIIVVEGRADVLNLLRNGVKNVIGMDGTKLPAEIKELSYDKEMTLFVDGDRGGKLIAKNVIDSARVDFIAFAPDGKEVEELSNKEILVALRKKITVQEFSSSSSRGRGRSRERTSYRGRRTREQREEKTEEQTEPEKGVDLEGKQKELKGFLSEVENTKSALLLDSNLEKIEKISARALMSYISKMRKKPYVIVVDTATPGVVRAAETGNVNSIVANKFAYTEDTSVNLISL